MTINWKQIGIFLALMILVVALGNLIFRYIIPIKSVKLNSESMAPTYYKGDVLFYSPLISYNINDIILYKPLIRPQSIVVRIIEENPDGTFKVKGDNPQTNPIPIAQLDQNNLKKEQIIGKISFGTKSYIFYPLVYGIEIILAILLTILISKKIKK
ncbi:signal peptidase I [Candidatus Woesearchaeota archaeon]|nr:signal peptidase I [Candidatus Woesearchaeota archaeon]